MSLAPKEIIERIQKRFPEAVASVSEGPVDPYAVLRRDDLVRVCRFLMGDPELLFNYCSSVGGVDDTRTFWVVYHLYSIPKSHSITLKVDAGRDDPWVPSVSELWPGANWHEREAYDLYGIRFEGHPDLRRILLPEDWPGHPLRKDYRFPEDYQGIPLR